VEVYGDTNKVARHRVINKSGGKHNRWRGQEMIVQKTFMCFHTTKSQKVAKGTVGRDEKFI